MTAEPDPTTGERVHSHETGGAWHVTRWQVPGCPACTPGDVEALAIALCDSNDSWAHHDATDDHPCLNCKAQAVDFLASGWLDAVIRKAGDDALTEAADAWLHHRRHNRCGLGDPDVCGHPDCPDMHAPAEPDPTAGGRCPHYGGRLNECGICTGCDA